MSSVVSDHACVEWFQVCMWLLWADDWCQWKTLLYNNSSSVARLWVGRRCMRHSAACVPCQLSQLVCDAAGLLWTARQTPATAAKTNSRVNTLNISCLHFSIYLALFWHQQT